MFHEHQYDVFIGITTLTDMKLPITEIKHVQQAALLCQIGLLGK